MNLLEWANNYSVQLDSVAIFWARKGHAEMGEVYDSLCHGTFVMDFTFCVMLRSCRTLIVIWSSR